MHFPSVSAAACLFGALAHLVFADCECGYSVNSTKESDHSVFTDILESDFTTLKNISVDTDWVLQEWTVEQENSKGPYGRKTMARNAVSNPASDLKVSDDGILGGQAGLRLYVRKINQGDQYVSVVEVDTFRTDMMYGSFRAGIKSTNINGTCGAFFWYFNDTQEIDIEFLSSQLNDSTSPLNLVLHSTLSLKNGGDASSTPTFKVIQLPFEADNAVHEYRFDWQPDRVSFYADSQLLTDMTESQFIPSTAGKIVLSHWSNGNPLWSSGPPEEDTFMLVQYVKAYFNTTSEDRLRDYGRRCNPNSTNAVCQIPDQVGAPLFYPDNSPQRPYFFSQDPSNNMTNNQTIYGEVESGRKSSHHSGVGPLLGISSRAILLISLLAVFSVESL